MWKGVERSIEEGEERVEKEGSVMIYHHFWLVAVYCSDEQKFRVTSCKNVLYNRLFYNIRRRFYRNLELE